MNEIEKFRAERAELVSSYAGNTALKAATSQFMVESIKARYSYNYDWAGRPIIQYPQDIVALQELVWRVKPDLIVECGIAHGGSLILSASLLALNEYCRAAQTGEMIDPRRPAAKVLGIDIDIRAHNRDAMEAHSLSNHIDMIQGSSTDRSVIEQVHEIATDYETVLVCLDSNHTHDHVLSELEAYAPLTSRGSYCIVFDTVVEELPDDLYADRPWSVGDNPMTAMHAYLGVLGNEGRQGVDGEALQFEIDTALEDKLQITVAPSGYLKRV